MSKLKGLCAPIQGMAAVLVAATLAGPVAAADFPTKPIQVIIPTRSGGGTDTSIRYLAELAKEPFSQNIVIINRPGGGGTVGLTAVTQTRPDGYTLGGLWNAPLTMTPHSLEVPYQLDDYTPLLMVTSSPMVYCVKADFPADSGKEFIANVKANPGKYSYGNDGVGGTVQLATERISNVLGLSLRPVPFTGSSETLAAFLGEHVDIYAGSMTGIIPHVKDGKAKCLMLTSAEGVDVLPQASGLADLGAGDAATVLWRGIIAPNGLPADVQKTLEDGFAEAAESQKFKDFMMKRGEQAVAVRSDEFTKIVANEYKAFREIVERLGLAK